MKTLDALILSLPTRNSTVRMRVWRTLKALGCGVLRDGVYVLPAGSAGSTALARTASEIRAAGGFALMVELKVKAAGDVEQVRKLFDRSADYGVFVERVGATESALPRLRQRKAHTAVARLQRAFDALSEIDFFPGPARQQAADALAACKLHLEVAYAAGEPRAAHKPPQRVRASRYRKRVWATRAQPWVDRLASAWLIKRFIDRDARFVWIEHPRQRPRSAVGFDFDGAEFTHAGHRVTFEVLVTSFALDGDPALAAIGRAVHFLDIGGIPVADASGLETMLRGIKEKARDDDGLLAESMRILDLLYAAYTRAGRA